MTTSNEQFKELKNYEKLLVTAKMFANSKGYYGRLLASLEGLDDDDIIELQTIDELTNANTPLDVVLFLED